MSKEPETEQEQFTRIAKKMPAILRKLGDALMLTANALEDLVYALEEFNEDVLEEENGS